MPAKFHAAHYNAIAKDIREEFPVENGDHGTYMRNIQRGAIVNLAIKFAKRFYYDNENFDPLKFLDACSPDPELYPLSELWEEMELWEENDG